MVLRPGSASGASGDEGVWVFWSRRLTGPRRRMPPRALMPKAEWRHLGGEGTTAGSCTSPGAPSQSLLASLNAREERAKTPSAAADPIDSSGRTLVRYSTVLYCTVRTSDLIPYLIVQSRSLSTTPYPRVRTVPYTHHTHLLLYRVLQAV